MPTSRRRKMRDGRRKRKTAGRAAKFHERYVVYNGGLFMAVAIVYKGYGALELYRNDERKKVTQKDLLKVRLAKDSDVVLARLGGYIIPDQATSKPVSKLLRGKIEYWRNHAQKVIN